MSAGSEDKIYFRDMTFGRHGATDSTMVFFVLLISYNLQHLVEARGSGMRLRDAGNLQRLLDAKRGAMFRECFEKEVSLMWRSASPLGNNGCHISISMNGLVV